MTSYRKFLLVGALCCLPLPAVAQGTVGGCTASEARVAGEALSRAKDLTFNAAASVGNTPEYRRWFGTYSPTRAAKVRANLKSIVAAIRSGAVEMRCVPTQVDTCEGGGYAWVYAPQHYVLRLCPDFFALPALAELQPGTTGSDDGTREGTIVHELSHFVRTANTEDHCYSRSLCAQMARSDAVKAVDNADSYQYFTEDVTYYSGQDLSVSPPVKSKPVVDQR